MRVQTAHVDFMLWRCSWHGRRIHAVEVLGEQMMCLPMALPESFARSATRLIFCLPRRTPHGGL